MITNKLKECCYKCNNPDIDVNSSSSCAIYVKGKLLFDSCTDCIIYCTHAKVCKTYLESEDSE